MSILNPLADLVAWVIMHLHAGLGALFGPDTGLAWGLSIAILVILIRLCLVPLVIKQVHAQRKMAQHAPHLQELRKKYKNDKQRLNEETMKFYKENGKAAMTLASSSVTGMASSTSGRSTVAWLATPVAPAKTAQAQRPAIRPSAVPGEQRGGGQRAAPPRRPCRATATWCSRGS